MLKDFFVVVIAFLFYNGSAQNTEIDTHNDVLYDKAVNLFSNKQYAAAQTFFKKIRETTSANVNVKNAANLDYYLAKSAIYLEQPNAEYLIENFVANYPTHPKTKKLYFDLGNYYFDAGKYANTRNWYQNVDYNGLSQQEKDTYNFNLGYALYASKRYEQAEKYLKAVSKKSPNFSQANYYLGYVAYNDNDYDKADAFFEEIDDKSQLSNQLSYYKADKFFKQGNFIKAIEEANKELSKANNKEQSELNKIIGESYFNQKAYAEAIDYLELYKGKGGKWNNTDHYILGYAYYKTNNFEKAISKFNRIIGGKDAVAQNAYYHLADAYLKLNKKQEALNAFKNAYEMSFDTAIKKDAGYNYAKLSYEIGNSYESVPTVIRTYLIQYPNNDYKDELSSLLVDSYVTTKNYKEALEVLALDNNLKNKAIYQKVSYLYGINFFQNQQFSEAEGQFENASKITDNGNEEIMQLATFWKGESAFKLGNFEAAISSYAQVKDTYVDKTLQLKNYQLGYSYFKLKKYNQALSYFIKFLDSEPEKDYKQDAILRTADSYYVLASYWNAIKYYDKALQLDHPKSDYALYQKAMSYGFIQKNTEKIGQLEQFLNSYNSSSYKDDALYALANVYVAENNVSKGIANYQRLQKELPDSELVAKSILKEGLIYYNQNDTDRALERLKFIAENYPKSAEAIQAVKTARLVYIDSGDTQAYADWVSTLNFVEITNEDLDNTTYLAAEKPFLDNKTPEAISAFEKYLKQFPEGLHSLESHFYLGQLYQKNNQNTKALPHFIEVTKREKNIYTETALYQTGQIYLQAQQYDKAVPYLIKLEKEADFDQNINFAKINLMKSYNELKSYEKTLAYAEKVLNNAAVEKSIQSDARLYKARAAMALGKEVVAEAAYKNILPTVNAAIAAEATYHLALINTNKKAYETSNTYIQKLAKDYPSFRAYSAKGLILMARNFEGLGDAYQASFILSSVIDNFKDYPQQVKEAEVLLEKIKTEEAKVNSSINE